MRSAVHRFVLVPVNALDTLPGVRRYWSDLIAADLIKYRMPQAEKPALENVQKMLGQKSARCFACVDMLERRVCGETMLTDIAALSARVHFSVHPDYRGQNALSMAREGAEQLFRVYLHQGRGYLKTLIGCTPVTNKLACRFIQKVGYKPKCVLTNVYFLAYAGGKVVDGLITQLEETDIIW